MKILIATGIFPPDIGGPSVYSAALAGEFSSRKIEIVVVTYGEDADSEFKAEGAKFQFETKSYCKIVKISRRITKGVRHLLYFWAIFKNAKDADAILAFDSLSAGLPALAASVILRKKIILRLGGDFLWEKAVEKGRVFCTLREFYDKNYYKDFFWPERVLIRFVLRKVDILIFSTEFQREIFLEPYRLKKEKIKVIKNILPVRISESRNFGFPRSGQNEKVFLFAGRFLKLKNLTFLIDVFKDIIACDPEVKLTIMGEGPERETLELQITNQGLRGKSIILKNAVSQKDLANKIRESYACVLPSLSEISPNFALECISQNTPIILTEETGIKNDFPNLLYFNPKSKSDLRAKIEFLLDKNYYTAYKNNLYKISFSRSWSDIAEDWLELIR
jgi:glycosyltransferase involved in cell wall biosynthesis